MTWARPLACIVHIWHQVLFIYFVSTGTTPVSLQQCVSRNMAGLPLLWKLVEHASLLTAYTSCWSAQHVNVVLLLLDRHWTLLTVQDVSVTSLSRGTAQHIELLWRLLVSKGAIIQRVQVVGDIQRAKRVHDTLSIGWLMTDTSLAHGWGVSCVDASIQVFSCALDQTIQM